VCGRGIQPLQGFLVLRLKRASSLLRFLGNHLGEALIERLHAEDCPVCMEEYICAILPSRIRFRMRRADHDLVRGRAPPPVRLSSVCEITARSDSDNIERTMSFSSPGNTSTMRSMVLAQSWYAACRIRGGRFRGGQRQTDGLQVAHFADQHDVRILAQCRAQRFAESERVAFDFALVDQAALAFVHEFDRVLDRDDVIGPIVIAVVNHSGQRRGLARTGRAGYKHQAARQQAQIAEDLRA